MEYIENNTHNTGDVGEDLAVEFLLKPRTNVVLPYTKILRLDKDGVKFPFFDLLAVLGNGPICDAVSVKARHMYDAHGKLKLAYRLATCSRADQDKLGITCEKKIAKAVARLAERYPQFQLRDQKFLAIQIDGPVLSAYLGQIADVRHTECHLDIGLTEREKIRYLCLADRYSHERDLPRNVYG